MQQMPTTGIVFIATTLSRLIVHCLIRDQSGQSVPPTLIGADHDTTPTHEVEDWLATQLDVAIVRQTSGARARANRRCRSTLLESIGFTLSYPTWREGYAAALNTRATSGQA